MADTALYEVLGVSKTANENDLKKVSIINILFQAYYYEFMT